MANYKHRFYKLDIYDAPMQMKQPMILAIIIPQTDIDINLHPCRAIHPYICPALILQGHTGINDLVIITIIDAGN